MIEQFVYSECKSVTAVFRTCELRSKWRPTFHLITRLSSKHGGLTQRACLTLGRALSLGRLMYGFPAYEFRACHVQDLDVLFKCLLIAWSQGFLTTPE